jgi:predicted DNA-binding transcriptional regulator AlpA
VSEVRYLNTEEVAKKIGVHPKTLRNWYNEGLFPKPQVFGKRTLRWLEPQIDEWLANRDPLRTKD